ncbi:hypothetical protein WA016_06186 [Myxococcus stipitatus]
MYAEQELQIVTRLRDLAQEKRFTDRDQRLLGYLFLVLHRLTLRSTSCVSRTRPCPNG